MTYDDQRLRDIAKELRQPADANDDLLTRVLAAREAGTRIDLDARRLGLRRSSPRWLAAAVVVLAVGTYLAVQLRTVTPEGDECMLNPQIRPLITIGLVVATACATDALLFPGEEPFASVQPTDRDLFGEPWIYVQTRVKDGERSSMPTVHELRFETDAGTGDWRAVTTVRNRTRDVRVDTTVIDRTHLQPRWSRSYGEINDKWSLMAESRWEGRSGVIARTVWPFGQENSVEVTMPGDLTVVTGLAHTILWFEHAELAPGWTGSVSTPSFADGPQFTTWEFAVVGEAAVQREAEAVPVWVVAVDPEQSPVFYYLTKETHRLIGYRVVFYDNMHHEVALVGWSLGETVRLLR